MQEGSLGSLLAALVRAHLTFSPWWRLHLIPAPPSLVMGGEGAALTVQDSVRGLRATVAGVTAADKGRLLHHDGRRATHW